MVKYRFPKTSCLNCGTQYPTDVHRVEDKGYVRYRCSSCGDRVLEGIVSEDGEILNPPSYPPPHCTMATLPEDIHWGRWEMWWTNNMSVEMINGRFINGEKALIPFVDEMESIYANDS